MQGLTRSRAAHSMPFQSCAVASGHRYWRFVRFPAFLLLLIVTGRASFISASEPPKTRNIDVGVTDDKDKPIAGAWLELRFNEKLVTSASTDAKGKASLLIPKPGTYILTVTKAGFFNSESVVETSTDTVPEVVEVVLSPAVVNQEKITVSATASNPVAETASAPATSIAPAQAKET